MVTCETPRLYGRVKSLMKNTTTSGADNKNLFDQVSRIVTASEHRTFENLIVTRRTGKKLNCKILAHDPALDL